MSECSASQPLIPGSESLPKRLHYWNLSIAGSEAALYMAAANMMGPMTLIPFVFRATGIDSAWLGLFTIGSLFAAIACPIGAAWAGGRAVRLPFCVRVGVFQRLAFLTVPLGVTFFFDRPMILLAMLVFAWAVSSFIGGIGWPPFQSVLTGGVRESWWGRLMGFRNLLASAATLCGTCFVWWVNRHFDTPQNYAILGWVGIGLLFVSLYLCSRFREVPLLPENHRPAQGPREALTTLRELVRADRRVLWITATYIVRSFGFLMGTYMTAVLIQRCNLKETQMWMPVAMIVLPELAAHAVSGWIIDRFGVKLAMILSSLLVAVNSIHLMHCDSLPEFVALFAVAVFGGSLFNNAWPTLAVKLAPTLRRPEYIATMSLLSAPGAIVSSLIGCLLVKWTGYDYVFWVSCAGGIGSVVLYVLTLPNIMTAPGK